MKRLVLSVAAAALLGGLGCDPGTRCGPSSGMVANVVDGDTIDLASGERIRYLLIDTPEATTEVECYGEEARQFNADLVAGREVTLRYDQECEDRFGRLLAYVSVDDREINTLLVERGFACLLHLPPNGDDRLEDFEALETRAMSEGRGLWGACEDSPC